MRKNLLAMSAATLVAGLGIASAGAVEVVRSIDGPAPTFGLSGGKSSSSANGGRNKVTRNRIHQRAAKKARNVRRNRLAHRG